jgi:hypothetical protein
MSRDHYGLMQKVSIDNVGVFLVFTCTVSLTLHIPMDMTVCNQYPDIELASSVCFCSRGTYYVHPVERTDVGAMMKVGFSFDLDELPGGIMMYEVQRSRNTMSDYQSNTDPTTAKTIGDTSKIMWLLIAWKIERSKKPRVHMVLVEHDKAHILNEYKLAQLYDKINDQFSRHYNVSKSTWLLSANTVLETTCEIVRKLGFELKITISKGVKDWRARPALWTDPER